MAHAKAGGKIGLVGFEPTASWSRTRRSTKLSHSPQKPDFSGGRGSYFAYFNPNRKKRTPRSDGFPPIISTRCCARCYSWIILRSHVAPLRSAVVDQTDAADSGSSHLNQVLELLRTLMEYRSADVRHRLEEVGRESSMLHVDVLLLIYHFARFSPGNVLEVGPYVGGSTIAAALGARESDTQKKIITVEAGGSLKHFRLSSRNIIKDLKKNLTRFGVAHDVTLIHGRSSEDAIKAEIHKRLASREVGLLIFDADNNVRRDLDAYGDLLRVGCWLVIDDYFGPAKAAPLRAQIDGLVSDGPLVPFGYYGWGTWVGRWQRK